MMNQLLYWIQSKLKTRQVTHGGQPYLERSYVCTVLGFRIYLHRFVACDEDGLHDHPFKQSFSILLSGWYWEDRWSGRSKVRWFNYIGPDCFHRVVLPRRGGDVWTLFTHTARVRPWGFFRKNKEGVLQFENMSGAEDPAYSDWSKDKTAAELRKEGKFFNIPAGQNAYQAGLLEYPISADSHKTTLGH